MLRVETVEPHTLSLLRELVKLPVLNTFSLVSLLYGHRKSVDLDLFSPQEFDNELVISGLKQKFGLAFDNRTSTPQFGIFCFVDQVKVDLVRHPHPLIRTVQEQDGFRMFSTEDIVAMKVQAVLQRGRKKDFWDIAELLNHFSIKDFIAFHREKYATQNLMITVPQAISYFADAEEDEDPVSLKNQTWKGVKESIGSRVRAYLT
jgi:hypothetical protein